MSTPDPIDRTNLAPKFWERKKLKHMSKTEWEALCDGCGKCCLNKIEDDETGEVFLTRVACRLFDDSTCRCGQYQTRHQFVPECISLTPETMSQHAYWLPKTCAYLLLWEDKALFEWHPLISGDFETVHEAGISIQGQSIPEFEVEEDDWEDHLIEEEH
jgi:hypothetical protein